MLVSEAPQLAPMFAPGVLQTSCPTRVVLDHVMSKWSPLVLAALGGLAEGEVLRWSDLRRRVQGVSEKMLAQTLRTLEADGLVHREARPVVPPHVEYSLTPLGRDLVAQLLPLLVWVVDHADEILGPDRVRSVANS
jgi:DNA-binding HxlR family transcriptional regulator